MATDTDYCLFGEVLKTFGTNGELLVKINKNVTDEKNEGPVFVEIDGLPVPFYFKLFERRGQRAKVIFENMESETLAAELVGKKILFPNSSVTDSEAVSELQELVGFTVSDKKHGTLGTVIYVYEFPGNPCLEIDSSEEKLIIPLNGVKRCDHAKKLIHTEIPEGLVELYSRQ
ncbi:MAG: hypothetical protein LBD59_07335 [Prevotellaceae bacterium]|jgi:16S rRNA processing protein RimM|nr:hypothetical protein [Prevotellaceae bacterium]